MEQEDEGADDVAEGAGYEDRPDDGPVGLVRAVLQDAQVGEAEGDFEPEDAEHVERSAHEVDLSS